MNLEFSKMLLFVDYIFMTALIILSCFNNDISNLAIAWIGQIAVSSGFYYWKAKNENRIKIPAEIVSTLKDEDKEKIDLTQVITTLVDKD